MARSSTAWGSTTARGPLAASGCPPARRRGFPPGAWAGSGLSRDERLPAALLARLLQWAWSGPVMPELVSSLPVRGLDGTQRRSSPGGSLARAHLKTGSLRDVAGIAGVVLGASGRRYVL